MVAIARTASGALLSGSAIAAARRGVAASLIGIAAACTPALDWRVARLDGGALTALFPCKPLEASRVATLHGLRVRMNLHSCNADGATYAVAHADLGDASRAAPALAQMQTALAANLGAATASGATVRIEGAGPTAQAQRLRLRGHLPDGSGVDEEALFFSRGAHVYQAVVLGKQTNAEAVDTFFGSLRLPT